MLLTQEFAKLRRKEFSKVKFQVSNKERVTEEKKKKRQRDLVSISGLAVNEPAG